MLKQIAIVTGYTCIFTKLLILEAAGLHNGMIRSDLQRNQGSPCGSAGKESACNMGDLGLIPGLERSPGEGKGYPL